MIEQRNKEREERVSLNTLSLEGFRPKHLSLETIYCKDYDQCILESSINADDLSIRFYLGVFNEKDLIKFGTDLLKFESEITKYHYLLEKYANACELLKNHPKYSPDNVIARAKVPTTQNSFSFYLKTNHYKPETELPYLTIEIESQTGDYVSDLGFPIDLREFATEIILLEDVITTHKEGLNK